MLSGVHDPKTIVHPDRKFRRPDELIDLIESFRRIDKDVIIQFLECTFFFGNFLNIDLNHCDFLNCKFELISEFNIPFLGNTRFTGSNFNKGLSINGRISERPASGLLRGDYSCSIIRCNVKDFVVPLNSELNVEHLLEGYRVNRTTIVDEYASSQNNVDVRRWMLMGLDILQGAITHRDPVKINAIKYAHYKRLITRNVELHIHLLKECSSVKVRNFSNLAIFSANLSDTLDFSSIYLNDLTFNLSKFRQKVNLTSGKLYNADFSGAKFLGGVEVDLNNLDQWQEANFSEAFCKSIYLRNSTQNPDLTFQIEPQYMYKKLVEEYDVCIRKNKPRVKQFEIFLKNHCLSEAETFILNLFAQKLWMHETLKEVCFNLMKFFTFQQRLLATHHLSENSDPKSLKNFFDLHTSHYSIDQLHNEVIRAIEGQKEGLWKELDQNEALEGSPNQEQAVRQVRRLNGKLRELTTLLSDQLTSHDKVMMLKLVIYYAKFLNQNTPIFSNLVPQNLLLEESLLKMYEQEIGFKRNEIERLLRRNAPPSLFFSMRNEEPQREVEELSTCPGSPVSVG